MAARPIEDRTAPIASGAVNLLFVAPALLLFGGFVLLPVGSAFYYAFTHWDGFTAPRWAGLANFQRAFADSTHSCRYVHVVLYILGTLVFEVASGLLVAVLLNSDRRGFALLRGFFFSPVVLSHVGGGRALGLRPRLSLGPAEFAAAGPSARATSRSPGSASRRRRSLRSWWSRAGSSPASTW